MSNDVVTFGCRLNAYESEAIKKAVADSGQENLIVFNSCAVTSQAEQQLRQAIRRARRENAEARIVVTGCAAQIDPQRYAKMAEVDLVLGNQEKGKAESYSGEIAVTPSKNADLGHADKLFLQERARADDFLSVEEAAKIKVNDIMSVRETAPQMVSYFEDKTRAFLEVQNGCNHRCTFCIIPFGRGNSRSVLFGDIVAQTRKMVAMGHREIVLTGVDISDYGKDLDLKITLGQMVRRLLKLVPELPRLRLSSIDVAEIDDDILDLIANEPRFMPYLHISLQSGDDMILKRMKRRHNRQQVLDFCAKVRSLRADVTFGADIIAGFPTESEEMFRNSLDLIEEAGIVFTHIFPYSKREGTPAAKMPQIDGRVVKERARLLREKGAVELTRYLNSCVGKRLKVVIEKGGMAKSENFLDVRVDGGEVGDIVEVEVVGVDGGVLVGRI